MGKEALHELIEQVKDNEVEVVYFVLSRLVGNRSFAGMTFEEVEPEPDEIEIIAESKKAEAKGEKLYSYDDVFGGKSKKKVA